MTITSEKISGVAIQILNLRLFPLFIENKIKDCEDKVWHAILLLSEIVEITMSPTIHLSYISYLQSIIIDYIFMRSDLFPNIQLRPKHHCLMHYPELIMKYGPLIKV